MRLHEILKIIIISYEALFSIIIFVIYSYCPKIFVEIGNSLKNNNDILNLLIYILCVSVGYSIKQASQILTPMSNNKILYEWKGYWKLKYRVIVSIVICAFCVLIYISTWVFISSISESQVGILFITSIIIPLIVDINLLCSKFKIRELMDMYSNR